MSCGVEETGGQLRVKLSIDTRTVFECCTNFCSRLFFVDFSFQGRSVTSLLLFLLLQPVGVAMRLIKRTMSTCYSLYKSLCLSLVWLLLVCSRLFWVVYLGMVFSCETCSVWPYTILCQTECVHILCCFLVLYTFPFLC